jgi:hypothetical protein
MTDSKELDIARKHDTDLAVNIEMVASDQASEFDYREHVRLGREVVRRSAWALGMLAASVGNRLGETNLSQYADDIGVKNSTLRSYRATYVAWPEAVGRPTHYSVAQALNTLEDRYDLIKANPGMTVREARQIADQRHEESPVPWQEDAMTGKAGDADEVAEPVGKAKTGDVLPLPKRDHGRFTEFVKDIEGTLTSVIPKMNQEDRTAMLGVLVRAMRLISPGGRATGTEG